MRTRITATLLCTSACVFCAAPASASVAQETVVPATPPDTTSAEQSAPTNPSPAATVAAEQPAPPAVDETIVITASRRAQNLQDVPLSVSAFTGAALVARGIDNTLDLQQVTPGLIFNQNANFAQPYIRGVGTDITTPGSESSVSTYIDGVYQPFPFFGIQVLSGIDRVEVLKGPQGTLYGRNATGGSINVQTRLPGTRTAVDADISYGNYDHVLFRGYASTPLGDTAAANIAVAYSHRDGFGKNLSTGGNYNSEDYQYVRSRLRFTPSETVELILSGYYFHRNDDAFEAYTYADQFGSIPLAPALGGRVTTNSQNVYTAYSLKNRVNAYGASLNAKIHTGVGDIVSVTAYQKARAFIGPDFLSTDIPVFDFFANEDTGRSVSEEVYLTGSSGRISYVLGANVASSSARFDSLNVIVGTALATTAYQYVDTSAYSAYGEGTVALTDQFSIIGGLRYSSEKKTQDRLTTFLGDGTLIQDEPKRSKRWNNVSFRGVAKYDTGPFMAYVSYQTGFKSGSVVAAQPGVFIKPETVGSLEAGIRTQFADKRLRLNASAFAYSFKNLQSQYTDINSGQALVESAPRARIRGLELQAIYVPSSVWSFDAGLTYLNSKYLEFISNGAFVPNSTFAPGAPGNSSATLNLAGNDIVRTPALTVTAGANFNQPLRNDSDIHASLNASYSSRYYFDITNRTKQRPYALFNGQIGYTLPGGRFSIDLFGRNIFNKRYFAVVTPISFGDQAALAPPRTFGIRGSFKY